jgi:glycosyltransferase involved in cell wall biosynthesis
MPRILYLSKNFDFPLGGVKVAYQHVRMLVEAGFDASILLISRDTQRWFDIDAPELFVEDGFRPDPDDVVVIPECWPDTLMEWEHVPVRRFVFCQNHYYLFQGLRTRRDFGAYNVERLFCCGEVIRDFLCGTFELDDVPIVHNAIDLELFRPGRKRRLVAIMPRKMKREAQFLWQMFRRRYPEHGDFQVEMINNMTEMQTAEALGRSAIFLSLGRLEGFGLPPLEAMAAQCLVVGFHGDGGREYARTENGLWCAQDDYEACVVALKTAADAAVSNSPLYKRLVTGGRQTAERYGMPRMREELIAFWRRELARP